MNEPSLTIKLYGTSETVSEPRILKAGALSAEFEAGNLRHIRFGGTEIMRAVSFIVRDKNWGTYNPALDDLSIEESASGFTVSYRATVADDAQSLVYWARIVGTPTSITFAGEAEPQTQFLTNRTGFVVLHPLKGVAGRPVTIEHVDGAIEEGHFPDTISPLQPMMDLRTLAHKPLPGVKVACRMEGDTYEMEDQRNWTDASFKTYVRPLAKPWPYALAKGERVAQKIVLTVESDAAPASAESGPIALSLGKAIGTLPRIGVGMMHSEIAATQSSIDKLTQLGANYLVYHFNPRTDGPTGLRQAAEIAQKLGAEPWLEVVVCEVEKYDAEVYELGQTLAGLGSPFKVVFVSPEADLKATLPGSPWPPAAPLDALYRTARRAFPHARLGGGMYSFFTELNRKRPPLADLDLVGFTTVAVFHAGDDRTVIENLESLPFMAVTAREIAADRLFAVGPSAIGLRMNPYGEAPMKNPGNIRHAMQSNDPRQRGLLGAAWALGYVTQFSEGGASAISLGGTTGAQGVLSVRQPWPQPYFDEIGGYFPIFHVQRALAALSGRPARKLDVSDPMAIQGIAAEIDGRTLVFVANLTTQECVIELPVAMTAKRVLDADTFVTAAADPAFLDDLQPASGRTLTLGGFAVARLTV